MKRLIMVMFFLFSTMGLAEEKQVDETRELREKVIKLEAVIERIEKEQETSTNYYKEALNDSKGIYNGAIENNGNILKYIYLAISGVFTILAALLALIKWDNNKRLEKEKNEIKKENRRDLAKLKIENKKLVEKIQGLEETLQTSFENTLNENAEEIKEENEKLDIKMEAIEKKSEEIRVLSEKTDINFELNQIFNKKRENLYSGVLEKEFIKSSIIRELKELETIKKGYKEESKEQLYFEIGTRINGRPSIEYLNKVMEVNPQNIKAMNNRGLKRYSLGNREEALKDFDEVIKSDSSHINARYNKAFIYKEGYDYNKAIDEYKKIIKMRPREIEAYIYLGQVYFLNKNYKESEDAYTDGIKFIKDGLEREEFKDNKEIMKAKLLSYYHDRTESYIAQGKYKDALGDLVKFLEGSNKKEVKLSVMQENYDKFVKFIEAKANKKDLENEVLRRFKAKAEEGIVIVD